MEEVLEFTKRYTSSTPCEVQIHGDIVQIKEHFFLLEYKSSEEWLKEPRILVDMPDLEYALQWELYLMGGGVSDFFHESKITGQASYMDGLKSDRGSFLAASLNIREKAGLIRAYVPNWEKAILRLHQLDIPNSKKGYNQLIGLVSYLEDSTANPMSTSRLEAIGRDLYAAVGDTIRLWGSNSGTDADKKLKEVRVLGGFFTRICL